MKIEKIKLEGGNITKLIVPQKELADTASSGAIVVASNTLNYKRDVWETILKQGLGPTELIAGNETLGFLGEVSAADLISGEELAEHFNVTEGISVDSTIGWLKFYHEGRTLFVAKRPIRHSISWAHLYQKGLVYAAGTGPNPYQEPVDQSATVNIKGFQLAVRLMTGATKEWSTTAGREWNDLIYPVTNGTWASYSTTDINAGTSGNGAATWVQETTKRSDYRAIRGYQTIQVIWEASPVTYSTTAYGWRPVLELIE